ncbi:PQQ-binding-like beta-propeller repeat protein [Streptomyces sp. NBC_00237]|uniref:outer membrane protein assembly factor BamB family protein n=1 Tax=Streptomyces sp. NBC_00237 TaxID=2975687 RepID=UPI002259FB00|nr:PQQ-binding-like beta-propeller repeat protein [Streptomyces sp. NBC_00237]MCX5206237.1 PQQ-binding-like beta-propeller repeat protein [Streptomyces sp. NBC_00237]
MTHPPSQPPPEGFGVPQDPSHGAPQGLPPHPRQSGYGPPQAPGLPGPYASRPGSYGGPPVTPVPESPGPYGSRLNPHGGQPPQQLPGAPTLPGGGSGGGGWFKGRRAAIVGAVVAALLVIGGGVWLAVGGKAKTPPEARPGQDAKTSAPPSAGQGAGSDPGGGQHEDLNAGRKPGEAKVNWLLRNDVDLPGKGADVFGPWVVGDTVVVGVHESVTGHSAVDGTRKWALAMPTGLCAAPPAPAGNGTIVVGVNKPGNREKCTGLQQIDLRSGQAGWKKPIPKDANSPLPSDITLTISGGTVTVAGGQQSFAFSLADGQQLWGRRAQGSCQPNAFAGGPRLIAAASCPTSDPNQVQNEVSEVDPVTGRIKWAYRLDLGWRVEKVYSVSPLVLSAYQRDDSNTKKRAVLALTDAGKLRSRIQVGDDTYEPTCTGTFAAKAEGLEDCTGVAADTNTLYLATDSSASRTANAVVAFDLDTGKPKWRAAAPTGRTMTPLQLGTGGDLLLYLAASTDRGGSVASLPPTGGAPKVLLQHPASTAPIESTFWKARYVYANDAFYLANSSVSTAITDAEEKTKKIVMVFGK